MSEILGDKLNIVYEGTLLEITPELMKETILKQDKEIEQLKDVIKNKHLKEIERLNKRIKELEEGFKATTEDLCEESTKIEKAIEYIEKYDFITGYYEHNYDDVNDTYTHYTVKEELEEILYKGE